MCCRRAVARRSRFQVLGSKFQVSVTGYGLQVSSFRFMATFRQFEDIQAWKDSMSLAESVYLASQHGAFSKDFALRDQMRRAAISVSSNIAEGFERTSSQEFARFLSIAKGSVGELRSQLHLARRLGYLTDEQAESLHNLALSTGRKIAKLILYLQNPKQSQA